MGRDTSIYMFERAKTSTNLYNSLQTGAFKKFIEDQKKEFNDDTMSFDNILETVRKDANFLTPEDLFEVALFLREQVYKLIPGDHRYKDSEQIENLYNHCGITELFELPGKTMCTAYIFQYGNYTEFFPIVELKNDFGVNIQSEDFLRFNDYVILVMKRILESKLDDYDYQLTEEEEKIVDAIKIENQGNSLLFEVIEDELKFLIESSSSDNNGPYSQTIYQAYDFLSKSIEMKSRIDIQKNPRIIIVDTY